MPLLGLYAGGLVPQKGADYAPGPLPIAALVGKRGLNPLCAAQWASILPLGARGLCPRLQDHHERVLGKWFAGSLSGEDTSHTVPEVRKGVLGLAGNQSDRE